MNLIEEGKLKELIISFSEFLNVSAVLIIELNKNDKIQYFLENWLQANWEMIVEHFVCQESGKSILLKKYGEGADDLFDSLLVQQTYYQRVSLPSMHPTHKIVCFPAKDNLKCLSSKELINFSTKGLEFKQLYSTDIEGKFVSFAKPFNKVLLAEIPDKDGEEYPLESVALIDDLIFTLVETVPVIDYYVGD